MADGHLEETGKEQGEQLDEFFSGVRVLVERRNGGRFGSHNLRDLVEELDVKLHEDGIVLVVAERSDLRQAFDGRVTEHGHGEKFVHEKRDEGRLENEAQGYPGEEALQGEQRAVEQGRALAPL